MMKYREVMTQIFTEKIPNWMKYHEEKDVRIVRKVYSIGDLRYANDCDFLSSGMAKATALEKLKRHLPSSSNLTLNNNTILTSTLGKLLVRKLTHRSTTNMTKSTNDLSHESYSTNNIGENLQLLEEIGEGKFCTVFKARYRIKPNETILVAVKKFNLQEPIIDSSVYQDVKHPHIIQFFGLTTHTDQSMMIIVEYAPWKSLYHCLISSNSKREYPIDILLEYLKQIVSALTYLETKSIVYRNLSCRNFLVFSKSLIKLSDWSSMAWESPESVHCEDSPIGASVYSFAIAMWECFSYGETPWTEMTNDQIINRDNSANHQRLSRPPYATSELYQIMLLCWKFEPSERPTFSRLEKALADIELKRVRWKDQSIHSSDGFLPLQSCLLGPLIILDRCLHNSQSTNLIQCVSIDGQIGFVENENVEPIHVINLPQSVTMNSIFHRKTGIKRNSTKTKTKQISKDMISLPQPDFVHSFHVGMTGNKFTEKTDSTNVETIEQKLDDNSTSSLLAEVMQAFTEICPERDLNNSSPSISPFSNHHHPTIHPSIDNSLSTPDEHSSVSSSNPSKSDCHSHYSSISSLNSRSSSLQKPDLQPSITGQPLPPPPDLSSLGSKLTIATMKDNFQLPKSLTLQKYRTKKRFNLFT